MVARRNISVNKSVVCKQCNTSNNIDKYFCKSCGAFLLDRRDMNYNDLRMEEFKLKRIINNLCLVPHNRIIWDATVDRYAFTVEKLQALLNLKQLGSTVTLELGKDMQEFLNLCDKPEFEIAFVGTIKTGKSTLINSLLGKNYASMAVTPETAALTKFRSSAKDYIKVTFYSKDEWKQLWNSRTSGADAFMREYEELQADKIKDKWIGHKIYSQNISNSKIEQELAIWSSSKCAEHYFVKEIEVGISSLPKNFPAQVVFVDTPGLSDPVAYRSELTRQYIRRANAVFVCVDAQKVMKDEFETIASVFSFSSHAKEKVHIIATHWDKLNDPVEDWQEQKKWLVKQLVGPGFFPNEEMAQNNITYAAAFIYNLARDYNISDKAAIKGLKQFNLTMDYDGELIDNLDNIKEATNIGTINNIIVNSLVRNYKTYLMRDVTKRYNDLNYKLKRNSIEAKDGAENIITLSNSDYKKIEDAVAKAQKERDDLEVYKCKLDIILDTVRDSTKKRLDKVLEIIDKEVQKEI